MAVEPGKYDSILSALGGGGGPVAPVSEKYNGGSAVDVGSDFGRGPGSPGGNNISGNRGVQSSPYGSGGGGYSDDDVNTLLRKMSPEAIGDMQRKMQNVGLLPENFRSFGFVENTTRSGFSELLGVANMKDSSYATTLDGLVSGAENGLSGPAALAEARKEKARLNFSTRLNTYNRSDPAGVRQTAEQAFQQALGRKPTAQEQQRFVNTFMVAEKNNQTTVFNEQDRLAGEDLSREQGAIDADFANQPGMSGVDGLMAAIGTQESGNNYSARNGRTGASGKFQIMPANWPAWSAQAGLGSNAARSPENQEKVARYKLNEYVEKFGEDGAAVAWYAGPGAAAAYAKNPDASRFTRKQGKGDEPSIQEYVSQVRGRMGGAPSGGAVGHEGHSEGTEAAELDSRLAQLMADAPGKVSMGKKTRSYAEQVELYRKYKNGTGALAAKPGTSLHSDGRANDLKYDNPATKRWVLQNAGKYGLDFPLLSAGEDWHVEVKKGTLGGPSSGSPTAPNGQQISTNVTVQAQDMGAQAVEFARKSNPVETEAYDIGGQFQSLVQILQRGVV